MKNILLVVVLVLVAVGFIVIGVMRKGQGSDQIHIGVIPKETASVYWEGVHQGAIAAAEELGVKISWNGPEIETDRERQVQIVQDFIAQKVDGIVLAPNDNKALVPSVEKIYENNIPCVIIDSGVETDKYLSYMATDNYQGGAVAAKRLGELLGGKGKVLLVLWTPNSASTDQRAAGFRDTLASDFPGIELIDEKYPQPPTVEQSLGVVQDMLTKNTEVNGIFACNATTAAGALQALRGPGQAERGIKMVGFDALEMLVDGLRSGEIDSLVVQNPYMMGYKGVHAIVASLNGEEVESKVDTGVELVTKDRLEEPKIKELLNLQ
jgi:ribose transport system substrate-binding protein